MEKVSISGSSEYQQELQLFKDSKLFKRLKEKYRVKPYYEKNKNLRITALTSSYLFNLFSIAIGFLFMYKLFSTSLGPVLAIVVSSAILSTIEAFKRLILPPIAQTYLQFGKVAYIRTFIALTLVSISAFLSYQGGDTAIHNFTRKAQTINTDSIRTFYADLTLSKQDQQKQLSKVRYKGNTTRTSQKAINAIQQEINIIRGQENEAIRQAIEQNNSTIDQEGKTKYVNAFYFSLLALIIDLSLIICLVYIEYYDYTSLAEFGTLDEDDTATVPPNVSTVKDLKEITVKDDSKTIATTAKKQCLNCSNEFEAKNKKKKFCSTSCRVKNWEVKNKKKLTIPTT